MIIEREGLDFFQISICLPMKTASEAMEQVRRIYITHPPILKISKSDLFSNIAPLPLSKVRII
jgi:hypothetical protein